MGTSKAALERDSFVSAVSFGFTPRVLTVASVPGNVDELRGLQENVIGGQPIPAGTGLTVDRHILLEGGDNPEEVAPEVEYLSDIPNYAEEATRSSMQRSGNATASPFQLVHPSLLRLVCSANSLRRHANRLGGPGHRGAVEMAPCGQAR